MHRTTNIMQNGDAITSANHLYFRTAMTVMEEKILKNRMGVDKYKHESEGPKEYTQKYDVTTTLLELKFCDAKKNSRSRYGEPYSTKICYRHIQ